MSQLNVGIVLCGVGGQGTVLATRLIASAAMERGMQVNTAETIGMAQRGGSVFTHVRLGEGVATPLLGQGKADLIIAFEPAEAVRQLGHLKEGGCVVVANAPIVPVSAMTGGPAYHVDEILGYLREHVDKLVEVDARKAARDLGSAKCLNVVLLGAAVRTGMLGLDESDIAAALERLVPERFLELNRRALSYAQQSGKV